MYTITAADMQTIRALAKAIPPVTRTVPRELTGAQLLELGIVELNGQPILEQLTYTVPVLVEANLVEVITRIVRQEGMDEVQAIVEQLRTGRPMLTVMGTVMFSRTGTSIAA